MLPTRRVTPMARIQPLFQLAEHAAEDCSLGAIGLLRADGKAEEQVRGILLRAIRLVRQGSWNAALAVLLRTRSRLGFTPTAIMSGILDLCREMGMEQLAAHECLAFARDAVAMGCRDLALEACSAALILDGRAEFEIIREPARLREIAGWYEDTAAALARTLRCPSPGRRAGRPRVGLLVPNLVDDTVANTKTLLHLVRHLDRTRCEAVVYVTENLSRRESPLFPYGCCGGTSETRGAVSLRTIHEQGVPVHVAERSGTFTQSALALADRIAMDAPDLLIVQSGLACPIDWLAARLAAVPIKATIHNGTSLYMPGMDINFYDNPANLDREAGCWEPAFGQRVVLAQGTDVEELRAQPALSRAGLGIPADAVVIGTLSNHLDRRMSPDYLGTIADVLAAEKNAWFVGFGGGKLSAARDFFALRGLAARVRFGGRQACAGSALKVLDIYANEFPVGGSQSVIEAMACGIPVVALRWSGAHAESAGANAVGAAFAVPGPDVEAYRRRLRSWISDTAARREAAEAMRRRAERDFSVRAYARSVLDVGLEILESKRHGFVGEPEAGHAIQVREAV